MAAARWSLLVLGIL
ncbi:hypothetical protein ABFA07_000145, partial [Porites harrisoni]